MPANQTAREEIQYMDPRSLTPYSKNPRKNESAIPMVAKSIRDFGFRSPIIVDENLVVINGHTRLAAALSLNLEEVPVIVAKDLTPSQVKAFRLADNKVAEYSEWDEDLLQEELDDLEDIFNMADYGFLDNEELEDEKEAAEDNYYPQVPSDPKAHLGDIYKLGNNRLMCGSSTDPADMQKLLNGAVMDLVVTDPPYNVNYGANTDAQEKYGKSKGNGRRILNDNMSEGAFYEFLLDFYKNMLDALKEGGAYYIFHSDSEGLNFRKALEDAGGQNKQTLIWVMNALVLGRQDYQWQHEPILYGWKPGAGHYFTEDRTNATVIDDEINPDKMTKAELCDWIKQFKEQGPATTVLRENKPKANDLHPTMKPIKLVGRLVMNSSLKGENVLDCFGGSGSTLIACEQLMRPCYMMELDPRYVDVIIDRWEKLTGGKAELVHRRD